jgi:hypothetical protein
MNEAEQILALLNSIDERLAALEGSGRQPARQWFSPDEAAGMLGRKPYTVREWCRQGRVPSERSETGKRMIPAAEVERLRAGGALAPAVNLKQGA